MAKQTIELIPVSIMEPFNWQSVWEDLTADGWRLTRQRMFRPLFGRYWVVKAVHPTTETEFTVEAATIRIALKKMDRLIRRSSQG